GFRYYFTPLPGYFSPFPHGTDPLSVNRKYLGLPGGPGRFTRHSTNVVLLGKRLQHHRLFQLRDSHPLRSGIPPDSSTPCGHCGARQHTTTTPNNPDHATPAGYTT